MKDTSSTIGILEDITVESPEKRETPAPTYITVIDHRNEKEVKVDAVKELIQKSKVSGGQGTRKLFKLPIKLVSEISSKDHTTAPNTTGGS